MLLHAGFGAGRPAAGATQPSMMRATQVVTARPASGPASSYYCNAGSCYGTGDRVVMFGQLQTLLTAGMNQVHAMRPQYIGPPITAPAGVIDQSVVDALMSLSGSGYVGVPLTPVDVRITPDFVAANADAIAATLAQWLNMPFQSGAPYTAPNVNAGGRAAPAPTQTAPSQYQCWDGSTVADPAQCPAAPGAPSGGTPGGAGATEQPITPQFFTCPNGAIVNDPSACQPSALATVQGWFSNPVVKWGAIALGLLAGGLVFAKLVKRRPAASGVQGLGFEGLDDGFEPELDDDDY